MCTSFLDGHECIKLQQIDQETNIHVSLPPGSADPPEDIIVSDQYIQVVEGEVPPKIECRASSYPEATYIWQHGKETVLTGAVLNLDYPMERHRAGEYTCIAQNRHGNMTATSNFDVLCEYTWPRTVLRQ